MRRDFRSRRGQGLPGGDTAPPLPWQRRQQRGQRVPGAAQDTVHTQRDAGSAERVRERRLDQVHADTDKRPLEPEPGELLPTGHTVHR